LIKYHLKLSTLTKGGVFKMSEKWPKDVTHHCNVCGAKLDSLEEANKHFEETSKRQEGVLSIKLYDIIFEEFWGKIGLTIDIQKERFTGNHKNILNYVIGIFDLFLLSVEDDFRDDITFDERDIKINDKSVNVLDCLYNSEKEIVVDGRWLESIVAKSTIK